MYGMQQEEGGMKMPCFRSYYMDEPVSDRAKLACVKSLPNSGILGALLFSRFLFYACLELFPKPG